MHANDSGWFGTGDLERMTVNRGYYLSFTGFAIPARARALFELAVTVNSDVAKPTFIGGLRGDVFADFASEDFHISGFAVLLAVRT
jgi:hypothetical protein